MRDNLLVAAERPKWYSFLADIVRPARRADLEPSRSTGRSTRSGSSDVADTPAERPVATASASWSAWPGRSRPEPKLLLLDEPAAGLDTAESQLLGATCAASSTRRQPCS